MHNVGSQFRQLPMFMTPREIREQYQALDGDRDDVMEWVEDRPETDDELFERKYDEAESDIDFHDNSRKRRSLAESLRAEGVKNPISLQADHTRVGSEGKPEILGGHHRIAVMDWAKPHGLMPVEHFETYEDAQKSLGERY